MRTLIRAHSVRLTNARTAFGYRTPVAPLHSLTSFMSQQTESIKKKSSTLFPMMSAGGIISATDTMDNSLGDPAPPVASDPAGMIIGQAQTREELYTITRTVHDILGFIQENTGLPWWATIIASTVIIRTSMFPFMVLMQRSSAIMIKCRPQMDAITEQMEDAKKAAGGTLTREEQAMWSKKSFDLMSAKGFKGSHMAAGFLQAPIFMSFFFGLRSIGVSYDVSDGGIAWFQNLATFDPYYALPVVNCALALLSIEANQQEGAVTAQQKTMKNVLRVMMVIGLPVIAQFPAALFMYWTSNSLMTIILGLTLKNHTVRRALNIPIITDQDRTNALSEADKRAALAAMTPEEKNAKLIESQRVRAEVQASSRKKPASVQYVGQTDRGTKRKSSGKVSKNESRTNKRRKIQWKK